MRIKHSIPLVVATLSLLVAALPAAATGGDTLTNARDATAAYNDQASAQAAGYGLLTDAAGIACIDMPGIGAMGVYYVNGPPVDSGKIDAARPQALVYDVGSDGRLHLVALEYVVIKAGWDATHSGPPMLFGEKFIPNPADNRFGLPAFYALHAWIWKHNPSGMFSPFNPRVRCGEPLRAEASEDDALIGDTPDHSGH
jgi:hypothetical protein